MSIRHAVILSAGKGSRLYPETEHKPKCLLDLSGRTLLEWQLDALAIAGVRDVAIVTGFGHDLVAEVIARRDAAAGRIELVYNPFFQVADNLGSVWMARHRFDEDTLLLNGDTLVAPALVAQVLEGRGEIAVTVDRKADYDADDMKVLRDGDRLLRVGKAITTCNAESIGFLAFRGAGRAAFRETVEAMMMTPDGVRVWYLSVIDALAQRFAVTTTDIHGHAWQEVDYPSDLDAARALTARWSGEAWAAPAETS